MPIGIDGKLIINIQEEDDGFNDEGFVSLGKFPLPDAQEIRKNFSSAYLRRISFDSEGKNQEPFVLVMISEEDHEKLIQLNGIED